MKNMWKIFLGLMLMAWLVIDHVRKPPVPAAASDVAEAPKPDQAISLTSASGGESGGRTNFAEDMSLEKPNANSLVIEDSWAKELRELKKLAANDPDAAFALVTQMSDKHELKTAATAVCLVVVVKEPAKAMTAAWEFELGKYADESAENAALENLAKQWAKTDLVKAFVWASVLPADDEWRRDRVMKGIASAVAQIAPAEAARMVTTHINPESSVQIDATIEVLREWAAREYAGAMAWASLFPQGPLRERGIEELASTGTTQPTSENKAN